ncbi:type II secretion system protein [Desulfocurvibacter africanus]|uniref:type IV pilus modification PilV family protein n=1 Tax=Desulfocurvibacter africanus TaxID=873 RepID=UPI002FD977D5
MNRARGMPGASAQSVQIGQASQVSQAGFTLMEVLVAAVIVGLTVSVFFQLLSGSLRLEVRSRQTAEAVVESRMLFDQLMAMDVRDDEYPWSGEAEGRAWNVSMYAVDVPAPLDADAQSDEQSEDELLTVRTPSELYRFVLDFTARGGRNVRLSLYRDYEPGYFNDDFKNDHVQELAEGERPVLEELPPAEELEAAQE